MATRVRSTGATGAQEVAAAAAGLAALLGGVAWLVLVPAAELERRGVVSYDAYNRLLVAALMLFALALSGSVRVAPGHGRTARAGLVIAATGAAVLAVGNVVEFYGVLLQDDLNAQAAFEAGGSSTGSVPTSAGSSSGSACWSC